MIHDGPAWKGLKGAALNLRYTLLSSHVNSEDAFVIIRLRTARDAEKLRDTLRKDADVQESSAFSEDSRDVRWAGIHFRIEAAMPTGETK